MENVPLLDLDCVEGGICRSGAPHHSDIRMCHFSRFGIPQSISLYWRAGVTSRFPQTQKCRGRSRGPQSGSSRKCRYKASRGIVYPWGLFIYNITYTYY
jgi:hypothetical protein